MQYILVGMILALFIVGGLKAIFVATTCTVIMYMFAFLILRIMAE